MPIEKNPSDINGKIQLLKQTARDLNRDAEEFPALSKNTARILASVKMLELNISDIIDLQQD